MDIDSPLYDEHDPGPKPVVAEASDPATEGVPPASQTVPVDAPLAQGTAATSAEGGTASAADKGKRPTTSDQTEVAR